MTTQDLSFHEGENWKIDFTAHDETGAIMPLVSGPVVDFRISGLIDGEVVNLLTATLGDGVTITDAALGKAFILITVAKQAELLLDSKGIYYYEIKVSHGDLESIQAEGRFHVERSLFSQSVDPLLIQFQLRFPELIFDDNLISVYIQDAKRVVDADDSWQIADRDIATVYLAAHLLQMRKIAAQRASSTSSTIVDAGPIKTITAADRTVTFATNSTSIKAAQSVQKTGINQTVYGEMYLSMLRRNVIFIKRA
jgi:hypothetical protein